VATLPHRQFRLSIPCAGADDARGARSLIGAMPSSNAKLLFSLR